MNLLVLGACEGESTLPSCQRPMARAVHEGSDLGLADLHSEKQTLTVLWRTRTLRPRTSEVQILSVFLFTLKRVSEKLIAVEKDR